MAGRLIFRRRLPFLILAVGFIELLMASFSVGGPRSRYKVAVDPGSRNRSRAVMERSSGLWVQLHCELRVSVDRPLPDPISSPERGDMLSFTYFQPISMGSAGITPARFKVIDGNRVWLWRIIAGKSDLEGRTGLGVQAAWPNEGGPDNYEGMEVFDLPPLPELEPYVWSPWRQADEVRGGLFAAWEKMQGVGAESAPDGSPLPPRFTSSPEHPYELRCRTVLSDRLHIPLESEDANVTRPDPSAEEPDVAE